jgi:DNA-binding transcriptional ArsR family regulator
MRIIQALLRGEKLTAHQLQQRLTDVPQATLYRHLKKMVEAGVLDIAEEIPIRGTLEKVFVLADHGAHITAEDLRDATADDHMSLFMNFLAGMIGEYGRYIQHSGLDLMKDGVSYRQFSVYLTEEENLQMLYAIRDILKQAMENEPNEHRRKRIVYLVDFPEA